MISPLTPGATAAAASGIKLLRNTASRRNSACSASLSKSYDQDRAARMV